MAEVESTKYRNEHRDKSRVDSGRFNQPTQFHPDRARAHEDAVEIKNRDKR